MIYMMNYELLDSRIRGNDEEENSGMTKKRENEKAV